MSFVKFKCRLPKKNNPDFVCGRMLGGPTYNSILIHDYSKGPFEDVRYCDKHGFIKITLTDLNSPAVQESLLSDDVDMITAESVFNSVVHKIKREPGKDAG